MIVLSLTEAEARSLAGALARRASDMMNELVHTEEHSARAELRARYEELERLQQRLAELTSTTQPSSSGP